MTTRYLLKIVYPDNPKWFAMESLLNLAYYVNKKIKIKYLIKTTTSPS